MIDITEGITRLTDLGQFGIHVTNPLNACYRCGTDPRYVFDEQGNIQNWEGTSEPMIRTDGSALDELCQPCAFTDNSYNLYRPPYSAMTLWAVNPRPSGGPWPTSYCDAVVKIDGRFYYGQKGNEGYLIYLRDMQTGQWGRTLGVRSELPGELYETQELPEPIWGFNGGSIVYRNGRFVWYRPMHGRKYIRDERVNIHDLEQGRPIDNYFQVQQSIYQAGKRSRLTVAPLNYAAALLPLPWEF
jgi:hypothetical protein